MEAHPASKYQRARRASFPATPGPAELAGLWLGQFVRQPLRVGTGDGAAVTILQPGLPEQPGALFLADAALRFGEGEVETGAVRIGPPAGEEPEPLLEIVWDGPPGPRRIALCDQLLAPWEELADLVEAPSAVPAMSVSVREESPPYGKGTALPDPGRFLEMVRAAGLYRLRRRARRIGVRLAAVGRTQLLWELLAEALGYHRNQEPFRHLARRLPAAFLKPLEAAERAALLFGVAGFLPEELHRLPPASQAALRPLWDRWWKARAALGYAVLPPRAWSFHQLRPANRPERRLAALALLVPHLDRLERAVDHRDAPAFARVLSECRDPFWSRHATWKSRPSAEALQLIGAERIEDLVVNLFWPLVSLDAPEQAEAALAALPGADNRLLRAARARLPADLIPARALRGALLQQGLLQLDRDTAGDGWPRLLEAWS